MPLRNQPNSLQKAVMVSIARNFDYICYKAKTREEMCAMIYDESYLQVAGPFQHLRESLIGVEVLKCFFLSVCSLFLMFCACLFSSFSSILVS